MIRPLKREPDFRNLELVLEKKKPQRPTLFELFVCDEIIEKVSGRHLAGKNKLEKDVALIETYDSLGYDYSLIMPTEFAFIANNKLEKKSFSLNDGAVITDRKSFDQYNWPSAGDYDYTYVDKLAEYLPKGMEFLAWSSDGPLESVIKLVGYENLCYMLYDDETLAADIFEQVGKRTVEDYRQMLENPHIKGVVVGDDWGFNTQTLLPIEVYRKYLFPWHQEIVRMAHAGGRYAILHSCGQYQGVIEDIIQHMGYDGRHSYEDNIIPVEKAYEDLYPDIAVLGGIDVHFLSVASPHEIGRRSEEMLERTFNRGGYALGSGNSIPNYIPWENYKAMITKAYE